MDEKNVKCSRCGKIIPIDAQGKDRQDRGLSFQMRLEVDIEDLSKLRELCRQLKESYSSSVFMDIVAIKKRHGNFIIQFFFSDKSSRDESLKRTKEFGFNNLKTGEKDPLEGMSDDEVEYQISGDRETINLVSFYEQKEVKENVDK